MLENLTTYVCHDSCLTCKSSIALLSNASHHIFRVLRTGIAVVLRCCYLLQEGQQRDLQLDVAAAVHETSWLPTSLEVGVEGPGPDPTAHLFDELEQLEPHTLGCAKARSTVCAV